MPELRLSLDILLVEDNPGDVILFCEGLRKCPVHTDLRVAVDGEGALKFLFDELYTS